MPALQSVGPYTETWEVQYTFAANAAAYTRVRGKVRRSADDPQLDTSSQEIRARPTENIGIVDIYVSGTPSVDHAIDVYVDGVPQRINLIASTVNALQAGRAKLPAPVRIGPGSAIAPVAFNLAAVGASAVTVTSYWTVVIAPSR